MQSSLRNKVRLEIGEESVVTVRMGKEPITHTHKGHDYAQKMRKV